MMSACSLLLMQMPRVFNEIKRTKLIPNPNGWQKEVWGYKPYDLLGR